MVRRIAYYAITEGEVKYASKSELQDQHCDM